MLFSKIEMTQCCGQVLHAVVSHASSKMMILSHCCKAKLFFTCSELSSCPEESHCAINLSTGGAGLVITAVE